MKTFVITGCSTTENLGYMIAKSIKENIEDSYVVAIANNSSAPIVFSDLDKVSDHTMCCDLTDDMQIRNTIFQIIENYDEIYCLINCAGMNGNYWFEDMCEQRYDDIMDVNAKSIYKFTQGLLPILSDSKGTVLNIVSNAAHVPMRCSMAYNASKAAAKMITMQLARELTQKYDITVFSISPNKLKNTAMSKYIDEKIEEVRGWSAEQSKEYQLNALVTGEETDPEQIAELVSFLLEKKERHFYLSGCDIPYGA